MGQKVHPYGFRLGIIRESRSKWFAQGREYRDRLVEDLLARKLIMERHHHAGISNILIERAAGTTTITIESAKPGLIIGRGGADVDKLRRDLDQIVSGRVRVNVEETKDLETNAQLIAEEIASQIERRASIRRAMTQAVERAVRAGVKGIRVAVSGRLMGAEIARTERLGPIGSVPLHTLRADVDRGFAEAVTGYGHIGVQVLVCTGEILPPTRQKPVEEAAEPTAEEAAESAPEAAETVELDDVLAAGAETDGAAVSASTEEPAEEPTEEPVEVAESEKAAEAAETAEPGEAEEAVETAEAEEPSEAVVESEPAEEDTGDVDAQEE